LAPEDLEREFPSTAAAYKLDHGQSVVGLLEKISADDRLRQRRALVRKDSLGDFPEGSLARFKAVIQNSLR
jgi:hypothetical protein